MRDITLEDCRDLMCLDSPSLSAEEAAFILWARFPHHSYEYVLSGTKAIAELKKVLDEFERNRKAD
jgi:hypothetical protein